MGPNQIFVLVSFSICVSREASRVVLEDPESATVPDFCSFPGFPLLFLGPSPPPASICKGNSKLNSEFEDRAGFQPLGPFLVFAPSSRMDFHIRLSAPSGKCDGRMVRSLFHRTLEN